MRDLPRTSSPSLPPLREAPSRIHWTRCGCGLQKMSSSHGSWGEGKDLEKQETGLLIPVHPGHRGKAWSDDTSQLGPDKHARDVPSLDKYAEERWEVRSGPLWASAVRPVPSSPRNPSLLTLFISRWSCISWWAPPVQLSARTWLNSSARPGL